jgi:uncharacterized protein (DUF1330 family)
MYGAMEETMRMLLAIGASMLSGLVLGGLTGQHLKAQPKPPVYFIVENDVNDVQSYLREYASRARDMIKANGGRYIAAGEATTFVGEPPKSRVAIFMFDDLAQIRAWLESPEYKELKKVGDKYAKFRNYAVPGVSN